MFVCLFLQKHVFVCKFGKNRKEEMPFELKLRTIRLGTQKHTGRGGVAVSAGGALRVLDRNSWDSLPEFLDFTQLGLGHVFFRTPQEIHVPI